MLGAVVVQIWIMLQTPFSADRDLVILFGRVSYPMLMVGSILLAHVNAKWLFSLYHRANFVLALIGLGNFILALVFGGYVVELVYPHTWVVSIWALDSGWLFPLALLTKPFYEKRMKDEQTSPASSK